jgi:hypothetical protein
MEHYIFLAHAVYELKTAVLHNCLSEAAEEILEKLSYHNWSPRRGNYRSMSSLLRTFFFFFSNMWAVTAECGSLRYVLCGKVINK